MFNMMLCCHFAIFVDVALASTLGDSNNLKFESKFATKTTYGNRIPEEGSLPWTAENVPEFLKPVAIDAVLRHGTRYPSWKRVKIWQKVFKEVKYHIMSSSELSEEVKNGIAVWENPFHEESSYLLSGLGWDEHVHLGFNYFSMMPELWSKVLTNDRILDHNNLLVQSSRKVRSLASARAFLTAIQLVDQIKIKDFLHPDVGFDEVKVSRRLNQEDENNVIQYGLIPVHVVDRMVRFFEHCEKYVKTVDENTTADHEFDKFLETEAVTKILNKTDGLEDKKLVYHMYQLCAFETALFNESVWCGLFNDTDIQVLEYGADLKHYYKTGHGYDINIHQACVLLKHILERFENATLSNPRATLRFGHAETLIPLTSLLGFHQENEHLASTNFYKNKNRDFRTGKISPFAGNLAVILYESTEGKRYISFVLNEQIIKPFNLDCYFCDFQYNSPAFNIMHGILHQRNCEEVCKLEDSISEKDEL